MLNIYDKWTRSLNKTTTQKFVQDMLFALINSKISLTVENPFKIGSKPIHAKTVHIPTILLVIFLEYVIKSKTSKMKLPKLEYTFPNFKYDKVRI